MRTLLGISDAQKGEENQKTTLIMSIKFPSGKAELPNIEIRNIAENRKADAR